MLTEDRGRVRRRTSDMIREVVKNSPQSDPRVHKYLYTGNVMLHCQATGLMAARSGETVPWEARPIEPQILSRTSPGFTSGHFPTFPMLSLFRLAPTSDVSIFVGNFVRGISYPSSTFARFEFDLSLTFPLYFR